VVHLGAPAPQSDPNSGGYDWARANNLAHELGHVLNLMHTYLGGGASAVCTIGPDFLYDVFGTNPNTCPHFPDWGTNAYIQEPPGPNSVITNNLMGSNKDNFWISGLQAAMMHQALEQMSVKRYVATACDDCVCCVAFMARGINLVSGVGYHVLSYATVDLNEGWGWTAGI
jgi:hypothetical protein